jgi:putative tryptophan/tyrosine transport system substrate-binding protein
LHLYATFREGLRQLGYIENQDYVIELRSAEGQLEKLPGLAAELVKINVDVIVTATTPAVLAAKQATDRIPIAQSYGNRKKIVELAAKYSLPAIYGDREFADDGGLMVYGPSILHQWNRAAAYVDRILKGAKPADMPVEGPSQFGLIINTKTAESLGLKIPVALLAAAETTERQGEKPQRPW